MVARDSFICGAAGPACFIGIVETASAGVILFRLSRRKLRSLEACRQPSRVHCSTGSFPKSEFTPSRLPQRLYRPSRIPCHLHSCLDRFDPPCSASFFEPDVLELGPRCEIRKSRLGLIIGIREGREVGCCHQGEPHGLNDNQ